jgi:hypothetical protein
LFSYNEDNNLCFFAAYANLLSGPFKDITKATTAARKLFKEYYEFKNSVKVNEKQLNKLVNEFSGVILTEEGMCDICNYFKLNLHIYQYNQESNNYSINKQFIYGSDFKDLHILEYSMEFDGKVVNHIMHISNPEKLTGILICPKCKLHSVETYHSKSNNVTTRFKNHVEKCDGTIKKKLKLDKVERPIIPNLTKNPELLYLMANNMLDQWKPKTNYLTFDCETIVNKNDNKDSNKTQNIGNLELLSIAFCCHVNNENEIKYFDRRNKNFMANFMNELFKYARKVYNANKNNESNNFIPVLGFNSKKFDINMIISSIAELNYSISNIVGSSSCYKQIIISDKENEKMKTLNFNLLMLLLL